MIDAIKKLRRIIEGLRRQGMAYEGAGKSAWQTAPRIGIGTGPRYCLSRVLITRRAIWGRA